MTYLCKGQHSTQRESTRSALFHCQVILILWLCSLNQARAEVTPFSPVLRQPIASGVPDLAKGKILVASRRLTDPSFAETVILLLEYSRDGAMGVVLNRSTDISLATVLPEIKALKKRKEVVALGGPVGQEQILLLAHSPKQPEHAQKVFGNCYIIVSQTALLHLMSGGAANVKLRAFAGYAGWAAGQLDAEVSRNDWHVVPAEATTVFDTPPEKMWKELIHHSEFEWAGAGQLRRQIRNFSSFFPTIVFPFEVRTAATVAGSNTLVTP